MNSIIHKLVMTNEAVCDYESISTGIMPIKDIKAEVELYIENMQSSSRLVWDKYFRVKYYDEDADKELMLFIYKRQRLRLMQYWEVSGICESRDWNQDLEDDGLIRNWLNTKIDSKDTIDWVLDFRLKQKRKTEMLNQTENEKYGEDYMQMVKDLLKNYKLNKARVAVADKDDVKAIELADKMDHLAKCISALDDEARELINDIYIKGMSLSKVGHKYGFSKAGIQYRRNRAIEALEMIFAERYDE